MSTETLDEKWYRRWRRIQEWMDVRGDVVMLGWTGAVVFKVLHGGLNTSDAMAYSAAVGAFGYSKGRQNETKMEASCGNAARLGPIASGAPLR